MSYNVPASFQVKYKNNVELALQQTMSVLEGTVTTQDDNSAESIKIKDIVGNVMPQRADERHGDTKYNHRTYDGIWVAKNPEFYDADLKDRADSLSTAIDIGSTIVMSSAATIQRGKDQAVLEGFFGPVSSGKGGQTTTPFPNANVIPVTTGATQPSPLNLQKIKAATTMLLKNYAIIPGMPNEKYMVLTADDNMALLNEVPVTSADFKGTFKGETNDDGMITKLLGWNFVHMELDNPMLGTVPGLSTDASGYRKTPFWVKRGVVLNFWDRLTTSIDVLPNKLLSVQYFAGTTCTATRTQAGLAGVILNQKG